MNPALTEMMICIFRSCGGGREEGGESEEGGGRSEEGGWKKEGDEARFPFHADHGQRGSSG